MTYISRPRVSACRSALTTGGTSQSSSANDPRTKANCPSPQAGDHTWGLPGKAFTYLKISFFQYFFPPSHEKGSAHVQAEIGEALGFRLQDRTTEKVRAQPPHRPSGTRSRSAGTPTMPRPSLPDFGLPNKTKTVFSLIWLPARRTGQEVVGPAGFSAQVMGSDGRRRV